MLRQKGDTMKIKKHTFEVTMEDFEEFGIEEYMQIIISALRRYGYDPAKVQAIKTEEAEVEL